MRDQPSLNRNIILPSLYLFYRPSNKIFVRMVFVFNSCYLILIEQTYDFVMCKCTCTTICINGSAQINFFVIMRLNISIFKSCDSLTV